MMKNFMEPKNGKDFEKQFFHEIITSAKSAGMSPQKCTTKKCAHAEVMIFHETWNHYAMHVMSKYTLDLNSLN